MLEASCGCEYLNPYLDADPLLKAIDTVLEGLRIPVSKALDPLDADEFLRIEARLVRRIRKAAKGASKEFVDDMKAVFRRVNLDDPVDVVNFGNEIKSALKGMDRAVVAAVTPVLEQGTLEIYKATKTSQAKKLFKDGKVNSRGLGRFGFKDERAFDLLSSNQALYLQAGVKGQIDNFEVRFRKELKIGLDQNLSQRDIGKRLNAAFGSTAGSKHYWNIVGSAWANRSRNWSNLETFDQAGFKRYEIIAMMDERTSAICRFMNGKVFRVQSQLGRLARQAKDDDPEGMKKWTPWMSSKKNEEGEDVFGFKRPSGRFTKVGVGSKDLVTPAKMQSFGIAMPPYHGLCRTTVGVSE